MSPDEIMIYGYLASIEAHLDYWEATALQEGEPLEQYVHAEDVRALINEIRRLRVDWSDALKAARDEDAATDDYKKRGRRNVINTL